MWNVPLDVHLRLFALRRSGKGNHAEHARANTLGNPLDDAAFAGCIPPLKDDYHLEALVPDPELELHELNLQLSQRLFDCLGSRGERMQDPQTR